VAEIGGEPILVLIADGRVHAGQSGGRYRKCPHRDAIGSC
jgi:hypothetical protein